MNCFLSFRYRESLSVRLEDKIEDMSEDEAGSEVMDGSVVSSVTDKFGFMSGETENESRVDLEIIRRREVKWVQMLASWDTYMMR